MLTGFIRDNWLISMKTSLHLCQLSAKNLVGAYMEKHCEDKLIVSVELQQSWLIRGLSAREKAVHDLVCCIIVQTAIGPNQYIFTNLRHGQS